MWLYGYGAMWLDQRGSKSFTLKEVHRFRYEPAAAPIHFQRDFEYYDDFQKHRTHILIDFQELIKNDFAGIEKLQFA